MQIPTKDQTSHNISQDVTRKAAQHLQGILSFAIQFTSAHKALVIADTDSQLAIILTEAYRQALPTATFIHFNAATPEEIFALFKTLQPSDLVVLIQSTSFRLKDFRVRVELFQQSLKVIEHPHLARMEGNEINYYIDSLAYDPVYYRQVGRNLKQLVDAAQIGVVDSGNEYLIFKSGFEPAKLNIGDYTGMTNVGGQFPIGEIFTEAKDLEAVNGRVRIFAFADTTFSVNVPAKPITLTVTRGRVTDTTDSTPEFDRVLSQIRADEGEVWLRELGFGMNRAFTRDRTVTDIGTYERMCGIHLSLGAKHGVYKKPNFKRGTTWHHVDVFAITDSVTLDDAVVYQDGEWIC